MQSNVVSLSYINDSYKLAKMSRNHILDFVEVNGLKD